MRPGIRARPWAGLDVGAYSVKLIATQGGIGSSRYWLAEVVLPKPENSPDRTHSRDVVAKAVAECLSQAGLSPRSFHGVSMGIAGPDVIVKQISLPFLSDDEVASALRYEARKHLPFDPQGMIIDFQVLARYPSEKRIDVLLAAVAEDHVAIQVEPLRALGMDADIIDAAPLALTNAIVHGGDQDGEQLVLLDIGHQSSHLAIHQRGEPFFTRRLEFGGQTLSRAIARAAKIPFDEAEEWKLAAGSDTPGFQVDWETPEMAAIHECMRTELLAELRRSLAFYSTIGRLRDNFSLWISGGTARLPGLAAQMTELLGHPVLLFNPLESLQGLPRGGFRPGVGPQFAQAFGLALRTA